jgi:5-(hydroxymethyl)furfural/furfural oxidase
MHRSFNYIIVGAGAGGCVLASRLTERASNSVLLIEAGADIPARAEPADIAGVYAASYFNKSYFWPGLKATWRRDAPRSAFPQARIFGGGGSVMGMVALRGTANDYDAWAQMGAAGWDWESVLPYFRKLENDWDFSGDLHGDAGPVPIRRLPRAEWPPLARAVEDCAQAAGLPFIADMNGDFRDGYGVVPMSCTTERRASSAMCYLDADVRRRDNLHVITSSRVDRVDFDGTRAVGVTVTTAGAQHTFRARETIITAGAIFSPALLMRSGVGDAAALRDLGISVVADLPGVGANLQNHPILFIGLHLHRHGRQHAALRTVPAVTLRYSSGFEGCAPNDLYINVQSKTSWNAMGRHIANVAPSLLKPCSRGRVSLDSASADMAPRVDFNFLDDARDLPRLVDAYTRAIGIVYSDAVRAIASEPFALRFSDRLRRLNERTRGNAIRSAVIAAAIDTVPGMRDLVVRNLVGARVDLRALASDPDRLAQHVTDNVAGVFHPAGTCRMGSAGDRAAVVDPSGRVYGVEGLRVADASIMPTIVAGNTNIPTIMIAEKIAAAM